MSAARAAHGAITPLLARQAEFANDPANTTAMPGQVESDSIADFLASRHRQQRIPGASGGTGLQFRFRQRLRLGPCLGPGQRLRFRLRLYVPPDYAIPY